MWLHLQWVTIFSGNNIFDLDVKKMWYIHRAEISELVQFGTDPDNHWSIDLFSIGRGNDLLSSFGGGPQPVHGQRISQSISIELWNQTENISDLIICVNLHNPKTQAWQSSCKNFYWHAGEFFCQSCHVGLSVSVFFPLISWSRPPCVSNQT